LSKGATGGFPRSPQVNVVSYPVIFGREEKGHKVPRRKSEEKRPHVRLRIGWREIFENTP
jgi:hypothetical protein